MAVIRWMVFLVVMPLLVLLLGTPTRAKVLEPGWIKTTVMEKISEMTGRALAIEGAFEVDLISWTPRLHAEGVRFANAPWGEEPYLLQAEEVTFTLDLRSLLQGRLVLPEVKLIAPRILLETSPQGQGNWELNPTAQKPASPSGFKIPMIGHLVIQDGRLVYRDRPQASAFEVRLDTATGQLQQEEMMTLQAQGRLQGQPLKVTFEGGSWLAFRAPDRPYPLTLHVELGKTSARLEGTIAQPETLTGVELAVALQGESLGFLAPFLERPLPESLPYRLQGQLLNPDGSTWTLEQFDSQLGNTDLKGDFTLDTSGKRPAISADLVSRTLDVNQLLTVWTAAESTQPSPAAATASEPHHVLERVLELQPLRQLDADVQLQADQLMAPQLTLNQALLNLSLQNGRLHLAPLRVALAEGRLEAELRLDAQRPLRSFLQADLEQIDLGQALKAVSPKAAELGILDGRLHLSLAPKPLDGPLTPAQLIERLRLQDSRSPPPMAVYSC